MNDKQKVIRADDESAAISLQSGRASSPFAEDAPASAPLSNSDAPFHESGNVSMPPVSGFFDVPEGGASLHLSLEVDDWGKIGISGPVPAALTAWT